MITHVVMFQLKEEANGLSKAENAKKMKTLLEGLVEKVESLQAMEVGINFNDSPAAFDVVLTSRHEDREGLKKYADHPAHLEVLSFILSVIADRKVVDFES
ncbi:Dabb family protein [Persicobacter psychrovividus]|uniref:Stress-response A/B barrel domain-containing protein n=1 Tax=Persicobacter psychrovividus TaxID=387638 RepID=A0ABM7VC27_9BACT|nr:hypothetical protein PEPS_07390 [Persicobacter psychrovividus]